MKITNDVACLIDDNGTPFSYMLDRYIRESDAIHSLLQAAGIKRLDGVVDYGCCLGGWAWQLAKTNKNVVGVDINPAYIEAAQKIADFNGLDNVSFKCAPDLSAIEENSKDAIISVGTLQVVGTGDFWESFFGNAHRVLKPGGKVVVNFATPLLPLEFLLTCEAWRPTYLKQKGFRWCMNRWKNWIYLVLNGLRAHKIESGQRYYSVRKKVAVDFIQSSGFKVIHTPALNKSLFEKPIESFNKGILRSKHYTWIVCEKAPHLLFLAMI